MVGYAWHQLGSTPDSLADSGFVSDSTTGETLVQVPGIGETIIIVVGGSYPTREMAEAEADSPILGDIQGFYVDVSDNYHVLGKYLQVSASYAAVDCSIAETKFDGTYAGACEPRSDDTVYVTLPVRLCLDEVLVPRHCVTEAIDSAAVPGGTS